ncbi:hypothetical protein ON010_g4771 [Phytophthora cinnamomi]|nr:hypothetical protein ON010_g4771 [Phytophthora cinnamomi]
MAMVLLTTPLSAFGSLPRQDVAAEVEVLAAVLRLGVSDDLGEARDALLRRDFPRVACHARDDALIEHVERRLGGSVAVSAAGPVVGDAPHARRDLPHRRRAVLGHGQLKVGQQRARHEEGAHGVHLEELHHLGLGDVRDAAAAAHAGVVDQQVDRFALERLGRLGDGRLVADVQRDDLGHRQLLQLVSATQDSTVNRKVGRPKPAASTYVGGTLDITSCSDDLPAVGHVVAREGQPDAAVAAGDKHGLGDTHGDSGAELIDSELATSTSGKKEKGMARAREADAPLVV